MGAEVLVAAQVFSAVQGYQAQRKQAKAQKAANAAALKQAGVEAQQAREDAAQKAKSEGQAARRARSEQLVRYLQSGVSLDGSPLLVAEETRAQGEENKRITLQNGESRAQSILLGGQAAQRPVQKADFFGSVAKGAQAVENYNNS